jgi:salicylate hydroxylase
VVSEQLQIAIVGGGIGGLTAALALRARGLNVTVFEQAGELREIGAGISLHPNAALLLERIGLTDRIKTIGVPIAGVVLRTSFGERIETSARPKGYNVHRAEFLNFAELQPNGTLHLGNRLSQARETNDRVQLTFANGAAAEADLAIGADGIHSVLQREIGLTTYPSSEASWPTEASFQSSGYLGPKKSAAECRCGSGKAAASCVIRCRAAA